MEDDKPKHKYEHMLMDAFGFTEDDLDMNRENRLSEAQIAKIEETRTMLGNVAILLLVAIVVGVLISIFLMRSVLLFGWAVGLALVVGIAAWVFVIWRWFTYSMILDKGVVEILEDRIQLDITTQKSVLYDLFVDNIHFSLSKEQFLALKNGEPYRIYVVPQLNKILSVEWLR